MKWWGWGEDGKSFPMADKPTLWPWMRETLGMAEAPPNPPIARERLVMPEPRRDQRFVSALAAVLEPPQMTSDDDARLHRCYGKSYPNLLDVRAGLIRRAPDLVVWPRSEADVERIVALAQAHDVCLVPFGGGTNIVGGVDPLPDETRMVVCLDMREMSALVSVDPHAMVAVIEAGATGPKIEADLAAHGLSLGHFPDSFEYSTLGGWLATRSAGMQSDAYGRIEDMVLGMTVVTPSGTITTRPVPASSAGPDLNRVLCGSEGVLGVITRAVMRVHAVPAVKDYRGFLFRSFADGVAAIHETLRAGHPPSLIRLQDEGETQLAFNMKTPPKGAAAMVQKLVKAHLARSGYTTPCIMVVGFEGDAASVSWHRRAALRILKKHGGFPLGGGIGRTWSKDKYNIPYLRDYVMDRGVMCDVAETSTTWDNVVPLHAKAIAAFEELFAREQGGHGFAGCHISHTYETGACLYFTYAAAQHRGEERAQYYRYKNRITDVFMQNGGTLSHHHAVGSEHMPWYEQEVGPNGRRAMVALKEEFDPKGILNPGKLLGAGEAMRRPSGAGLAAGSERRAS